MRYPVNNEIYGWTTTKRKKTAAAGIYSWILTFIGCKRASSTPPKHGCTRELRQNHTILKNMLLCPKSRDCRIWTHSWYAVTWWELWNWRPSYRWPRFLPAKIGVLLGFSFPKVITNRHTSCEARWVGGRCFGFWHSEIEAVEVRRADPDWFLVLDGVHSCQEGSSSAFWIFGFPKLALFCFWPHENLALMHGFSL